MDPLLTDPLQFAVCELLQGVQTHKRPLCLFVLPTWPLCHALRSRGSLQSVGPSVLNRLAGLFVLDFHAHQLLEKFGVESMSMHRFHPSITANLQNEFTALMFTEPNIVNFDG